MCTETASKWLNTCKQQVMNNITLVHDVMINNIITGAV